MSFYESVTVGIECDGVGCKEIFELNYHMSDAGLRDEAEDEGWWTSRYEAYCPECRAKYGHEEEEE